MEDNAAPVRKKNFQVNCYNCYLGGNLAETGHYTFVTQHVMWQKKGILSRFD